ncbi:MAG: DUF507 family protein [bacterium]
MRLRKRQIESIAENIVGELIKDEALRCDNDEDLKAFIRRVIMEDLLVEDKLNDEVRQILEAHSSEIRQGSIEYHKMFRLVKEKLAKERNIVL